MPDEQTFFSDASFLLEDFVNKSSFIFYICSLEKHFPIVNISHNAEAILGYKPEEFYEDATFWLDKIHPEDKANVNEAFIDIIAHKNRTFVYQFRKKDRSYLWLRDENTVLYDTDGNPKAIAGTAIDISKQKRAENEIKKLNETLEQRIDERTRNLTVTNRKLKKQIQYRNKAEMQLSAQQKKLRLLQAGINYINDMVIISKAPVNDPLSSEIVFVNKAFERFTGYFFREVKGKGASFLHGEQTQPGKLKKLNNCIKNHEPVRLEFINYKKDGSTYWVDLEISPFPSKEEGMEYWVGVNRDITKRKSTEIALEENEQKYRTYTELSFDAIFEIALDGTIIDCNARACHLFGYNKEELLGMNAEKLVPAKYKGSFPEEITAQITTNNKVLQRDYTKKDGSVFTAEINTKLYHHNGKDNLIAYVRDISEQIKHQDALEKSLREKDTLLAEVHHRVKNNLAVISGLLEMQAFNADNEQIVHELRESQSRIQSIATVHETLYQSESFSDIALDCYIDELVSFISGTFGHQGSQICFDNKIEPISLTVKQAVPCGLLLNELITNAYKHAFEGMEKGIISIHLSQHHNTVQLQVGDNGVGLPDNFDIEKPSSLGMTLISTLVRQLEGTLSIDKKPSTCFHITFKIE